MERTERGDAQYFHLDLANIDCGVVRATLFANRDGEAYMETQTDPALASSFAELGRCDTLTVLADGAKLLDDSARHQVHSDVCLTIRAFCEAGQLASHQRLALVLTKIDAIRANQTSAADRALRHFDLIAADVHGEFSSVFADIQLYRVAASPVAATAERGEGMPELVSFWLAPPTRMIHLSTPVAPVPSSRAFGRLRPSDGG